MNLSIKENRILMFFITLFTGSFGVHWFIQKNYKRGIFYLFTFGGFFVCWLYDICKSFFDIFDDKKIIKPKVVPPTQPIQHNIVNTIPNKTVSNYNEQKPIKQDYINLYRKVVFLRNYNGSPIRDNDKYPRYLFYDFKITNPSIFHKKLVTQGYLEPGSIDDTLKKLRIVDLKEILHSYKLPVSGNKDNLISRLKDNVPEETLKFLINDKSILVLTEKGKKLLKENQDLIDYHSYGLRWQIQLDEYIKVKKSLPFKGSFFDVAWGILDKRKLDNYYDKEFEALASTIYCMSELLGKEKKYKQSLQFLLAVFYLDTSGVFSLTYDREFIKSRDNEELEKVCNIIFTFAPGIIEQIIHYQKYFEPGMIDEVYTFYPLPLNYCSKQLFESMINELYFNDFFDKEKYFNILKNRFLKSI